MSKRVERKVVAKKHSLELPFDLSVIGTEDDPCFGKLFDPKEDICLRCGDSEFCNIILGQNNHAKRAAKEVKTPFKDVEKVEVDPQVFTSFIRKKLIKKQPRTISNLKKLAEKKFGSNDFIPLMEKACIRDAKIKITGNTVTY